MTIEEAIEIIKPIMKSPNLAMTKLQLEAGNLLLGHSASWGCHSCKISSINQIKTKYKL